MPQGHKRNLVDAFPGLVWDVDADADAVCEKMETKPSSAAANANEAVANCADTLHLMIPKRSQSDQLGLNIRGGCEFRLWVPHFPPASSRLVRASGVATLCAPSLSFVPGTISHSDPYTLNC